MKKLTFFVFIMMVSMASIKAQITLDTTFNNTLGIGYSFKLVNISRTESKWYFADTLTNTFSLYNMDFSPFLENITVPEPFALATSYMQVLYITRTLFDCDSSNIEYAYYSPANPTRPFRVVRTDGTILFQVDSSNAPFAYGTLLGGTDVIRPIVNTSDGAKLFLQKAPSLFEISVYSLCDSLVTDVFDFALHPSFVKLFPNPASGLLTFQINFPDNMNEYELLIIDNIGKVVNRKKLNTQIKNYSIDVNYLKSGIYYYSFCISEKVYQSGKFIINQ